MVQVSKTLLEHGFVETLLLATPAGFLVASIAWIMPNARGSEFWVIVLVTYAISIGGFSHVVAGSSEVWLLLFAGQASLGEALFHLLLPALLGNIIGGSGLFAVVAHGQVRDEIR
jgi:formate/nitrite transporter FocA (FNT family)